ncbi:MAG: DUF2213 domain-containing protein [Clostridiales bacterium]|nr:DUF2213 domain-containing protein [Clostridiales bacterium]
MAIAYFGSPISPNQIETAEGYLICKNVPIARTGSQNYLAREMGVADADPEAVIPVMRYPEDVFAPETIASFEGKPVTMTHPPEDVTPENWSAYAKGHVQNVRRTGEHIMADLVITDPTLIDQVRSGSMRQVSCGYRCDYAADPAGGYRQKRIRGNHVAVVPLGRAGAAVSIQDAAAPAAEKVRKSMNMFNRVILTALGKAAKDASPEELEELVATVETALDAEPAAQAQEAVPAADEMTEKVAGDDDLGGKLDKVLAMLGELAKKNDREEKMERKMSDEGDLEELIEKLTGEDGEEAATVTEHDAAPDPEVRDAALQILKNVRPAVAAIRDTRERARVVDALLKSVQSDAMTGVLGAVTRTAKAKADDAATAQQKYADRCREVESAYAARNPHMKKEEK